MGQREKRYDAWTRFLASWNNNKRIRVNWRERGRMEETSLNQAVRCRASACLNPPTPSLSTTNKNTPLGFYLNKLSVTDRYRVLRRLLHPTSPAPPSHSINSTILPSYTRKLQFLLSPAICYHYRFNHIFPLLFFRMYNRTFNYFSTIFFWILKS